MNTAQKQYLPGLDLLKFILAVLIISAHCHFLNEFPMFQQWWGHLTSIAVPLFFGISSFLFFRKIYSLPEDSNTCPILIHSIKRLAILFTCWYVLMIPMTYFKFYSVATLKETIYAILFSCCFNGYWFIKALIINTTILYFCRRTKTLIICSFMAFLVYVYCSFNYIYHYNPFLESLHPYYSFYYHTAYFCVGALFARFQDRIHFGKWRINVLIVFWIILYLLNSYKFFNPLYRLSTFAFLFPIFYQMKIKGSNSTFKYLRNMSIILYMVQFILIWLYNGACNKWIETDSATYHLLQFSAMRFIVITSLAILIAWSILTLEKRPRLSFLQYLH